MKRIMLSSALLLASTSAFAAAPGGPDCGWGNMLFDGSAGVPAHIGASSVNGTSGNASFGMTSGTNGCSAEGTLSYAGEDLMGLARVMDEFSGDVARGEGEALNAVAVMIGINPEDRAYFGKVAHRNFTVLFPSDDVTADQLTLNLNAMMKADARLAHYTS